MENFGNRRRRTGRSEAETRQAEIEKYEFRVIAALLNFLASLLGFTFTVVMLVDGHYLPEVLKTIGFAAVFFAFLAVVSGLWFLNQLHKVDALNGQERPDL